MKKNKPLNKTKKIAPKVDKKVSGISKRKPLNKIVKTKKAVKKNNKRPYSNISKTSSSGKYLPDIVEKRYIFMIVVIIILFSVIEVRLFQLQILKTDEYNEKLVAATVKYVEGDSSPRGRIYDRNYKLLVDNQAVKTIYYKKPSGTTSSDEIKLAYELADILDIDYSKLSSKMLKTFWYKNNPKKAQDKITKKERQKNAERKLSDDDLEKLIYERITDEDLSLI